MTAFNLAEFYNLQYHQVKFHTNFSAFIVASKPGVKGKHACPFQVLYYHSNKLIVFSNKFSAPSLQIEEISTPLAMVNHHRHMHCGHISTEIIISYFQVCIGTD